MKEDGSGFTKEFLNKTFVKKTLGSAAESLIDQENEEISESLREEEKQQQQKKEKLSSEIEKLLKK